MLTRSPSSSAMSRTALVVASLVGLLHAACGAGTPRPDDRADSDHDTVTDANDLCPLVPEDLDGLDDADGCPESEAADADHDGQPDHGDMCPCVAEDRDEFQDEDGCPDPDNDSDRIVDACDRCPNEPETYQGSCDDDGCPDASHVCVEEPPITIPARLQFDARSSRARPEHGELLDRIAQTLIENPQVQRLIVRGHATSRERDPSALALARAETVRMELVRRGVQRERLEVEGVPAGARPAQEVGPEPMLEDRFVELVIARAQDEDWIDGAPPPDSRHTGCGVPRCDPVPPCEPPPPPAPAC